ncbi:MAG: VOC family protein [Actinomycetota bacterium]|nr:VOC family protein [Actinomycetota bacterium]
MGIQRIETASYVVDDLDICIRFFTDLGLTPRARSERRAEFTTQTGQVVALALDPDPWLPPPVEDGPGIREIVWGVDTAEEVGRIVSSVAADREVTEVDGVFHTVDESGFGLGLTVASAVVPDTAPVRGNVSGHVVRWNEGIAAPPAQVRPLRICHVAWNIEKAGREEAVAFYTDRLGFRVTDLVKPMGAFMQAPGDDDQHTALLCWRPDRASTNHTSYEVASMDQVILGGNQMIAAGWQEARRLGRHTVGSNFFRFVHNPAGGRVELAADMDRVDDTYGPNVHEETPPHHLWTLEMNPSARERP